MVVYAGPSGRAAATGTRTDPFGSLESARDFLRALPDQRKTIRVLGGRYYGVALELDGRDSGLTIEAAPGARPLLFGGRPVTGWRKTGGKFWTADLPEVRSGAWDFRMLLVNGSRRRRARLPEKGRLRHESVFDVRWMSSTGGGWERKPTETELTTMSYRRDDLGKWLDTANAEITVYHQWDESRIGVSSIDPGSRTVKFASPSGHPPGAFGVHDYVVHNVAQGMRRPGAWYLDRSQGMLVYWPRHNEDMTRVTAVVPTSEFIIRVRGEPERPAERISIKGLSLRVTHTPLRAAGFGARLFDGAVSASGEVRRLSLRHLNIRNVGGHGIKIAGEAEKGSPSACRVAECEIASTGAGGALLQGKRAVFEDNHVHHTGLDYPSAVGVSCHGDGARVRHNDIHHTSYSAINAGGAGARVEANRLWKFMLELLDGAAIYVGFCKDATVRCNVVRGGAAERHAYYLDEQADHCIVERNLAVGTSSPLLNHMTRNCITRDNIFMGPRNSTIIFSRCRNCRFERNVVLAGGKILLRHNPSAVASWRNNILFSRHGSVEWGIVPDEQYEPMDVRPFSTVHGTILSDPRIRNLASERIEFLSGSPATALGIAAQDFRRAGRRPDRKPQTTGASHERNAEDGRA